MTVSVLFPMLLHFLTIDFPDLLTGNRLHRPSLQGSVFWMAPEVVKQTGHTRKADIWSVGCLVVEMLTGEHPWAQLTQMQAIFKAGATRHHLICVLNCFTDWLIRTASHPIRYLFRCPKLLTMHFRNQPRSAAISG
jgi:serine/threonine protein kinase